MARVKKSAPLTPGRGRKLTVGFGLVNVPLAIKPLAVTERPLPGKTMCPEHGPTTSSRLVCGYGTDEEHQLERSETLKGYEHPDKPGHYVALDESVIEELEEARSGSAQITKVVEASSVDSAYVGKTYLAWPQEGGEEAFDLLAAVLKETKKAAVTTAVLSKQTQLLVLRWSETMGTLLADVVRFDSALRHQDVELVQHVARSRTAPTKEMVAVAAQLLSTLDGAFDANDVEDELTPMLEDAIRAADAGKQYAPVAKPIPSTPAVDLMAALKASMAQVVPAPTKARKSRAKAA